MCEYCEEDKDGYRKVFNGGGGYIGWTLIDGWEFVRPTGNNIKINYCPMCGKRLGDE